MTSDGSQEPDEDVQRLFKANKRAGSPHRTNQQVLCDNVKRVCCMSFFDVLCV